ncbi:hypothetical protein HAX54_025955 [Datura stramonium]|uniref:Uncharacterized protein n=1 Tax=Datura stramonium TaxID=4076 RepID=A0ABS8V1M4_DATST|nr:hypothetical protein [Datura stramonium]
MDRSPRFGSISSDNCPMKTRFRYGSGGFPTATAYESPAHSSTGTRSEFSLAPPTAWELTGVFILARWSLLIHNGIPTCPMLLGQSVVIVMLSVTGLSPSRAAPISLAATTESLLLFPLWLLQDALVRQAVPLPAHGSKQRAERLPYSGISGSMLIFTSPKHFVDYYALPHLWVPRYPPSNRRIGKIGCYHKALYRLSSRVGDKRTRTADIRRRRTRNGGLSLSARTLLGLKNAGLRMSHCPSPDPDCPT